MAISLRLRATQEMKNLEEEVKATQEEKQTRHDQLDPLQEKA
jgi:hypothetical protein